MGTGHVDCLEINCMILSLIDMLVAPVFWYASFLHYLHAGHFPGRGANNSVGNMGGGGYGGGSAGMPHPGGNYNTTASQYGAMGNYGPRMTNHNSQGGYSSGSGNQMAPGHYPPGHQGIFFFFQCKS